MLRASSISLIVATSFSLSLCLQAGLASSNELSNSLIAQKSGDAKTSTKDAKPAAKEKTPEKKEAPKDTKGPAKDTKDAKSDAKDAKDTKAEAKEEPEKEVILTNVASVSPDQLIEKPKEYMGRNVRFTADFAGFCTLALNYKPAFRPQKTHISFLVRKTETKIPLSELKLALPIPKETDKVKNKLLTSLKDGDKLEVTGKVFSTALDEPWIDVVTLKRLSEAKKTAEETADDEEQ
jgi:lysyl-tRNA synthetase class II